MSKLDDIAAYFRDPERPRYTPRERRRLGLGIIVVVTTCLNSVLTTADDGVTAQTVASIAYVTSIILFTMYWRETAKYKDLRAGQAMLKRVLFDQFYETHQDAVSRLSSNVVVDNDYMGSVNGIDVRFSVDTEAEIPTVHVRYWGEFVPTQHAQPLTEGWTD